MSTSTSPLFKDLSHISESHSLSLCADMDSSATSTGTFASSDSTMEATSSLKHEDGDCKWEESSDLFFQSSERMAPGHEECLDSGDEQRAAHAVLYTPRPTIVRDTQCPGAPRKLCKRVGLSAMGRAERRKLKRLVFA